MSDEIPLGKREDLHLEFKSADSLKDPEKIAREVVAMLNADGGEVWVGLGEEEGRAVKVEAIPEPEASRQSLRDSLADSIEPAPSSEEISLGLVPAQNGLILRISVTASTNRPYALLKKSGRFYWRRFDDRILPMSREEIREAFNKTTARPEELARAEAEFSGERTQLLDWVRSNSADLYWLRIKPVPDFSLDLDALIRSDLLIDPTRTENRRVGENFTLAYTVGGRAPRLAGDRVIVGKDELFELSVHQHRGIEFKAPLKTFHAGVVPGEAKPLYWLSLLEYPISFFRLLSKMLLDKSLWEDPVPATTFFLASTALFGLEGWTLRPSSPQSLDYRHFHNYLIQNAARSYELPDLLPEPLRLPVADVKLRPDWSGFRVVRQIYAAFGYRADEMPLEFDQKAGRLILPV